MKMNKVRWIACCAACFFLLLGGANASTITVNFTGTVTQVPIDEVFGDISFGEQIQGSFSFDPSAPDLIPGDPSVGSYAFGAPFGMTASIGAHEFDAFGGMSIGILNSFVDQLTVLATNGAGDLTLELFMQDDTGRVFTNDHLPLAPPPEGSFAQKDFHLDAFFDDEEIQVDGQFGAAPTTEVPEPSTAILFLAASMALLALARRRRLLHSR
jgi:hypothetical protein